MYENGQFTPRLVVSKCRSVFAFNVLYLAPGWHGPCHDKSMDIANPQLMVRKRRRRLWLIGSGVTALLVLAVGVASLGPALPDAERSSLWVDAVKRGDMLREVRATGTLVPRESRWLAAATSAQVEKIEVWPGATVKPDTVLMRLSNPEVEDALPWRSIVTVART